MIADDLLRETVQALRNSGIQFHLRRKIEAYLEEFDGPPAEDLDIQPSTGECQAFIIEKLAAWYDSKRTSQCRAALELAEKDPLAAAEMWDLYNDLLVGGREDLGLRHDFFRRMFPNKIEELRNR